MIIKRLGAAAATLMVIFIALCVVTIYRRSMLPTNTADEADKIQTAKTTAAIEIGETREPTATNPAEHPDAATDPLETTTIAATDAATNKEAGTTAPAKVPTTAAATSTPKASTKVPTTAKTPSTTKASTKVPTTAKTPSTTKAPAATTPPTTIAPTTAAPTTAPPTTEAPATAAPTTAQPAPASDELSYPIRYEDGGVKITIEKQWFLGTCCYIAHVQLSDYSRLKTGLAEDSYGNDELPAAFAASHNCLLTVNGDYAEGDGKGVLRRGTVYGAASQIPDAAYSQSSGRFTSADGASLSALAEQGYTESFGFGAPALVRDGKSVYGRKDGGKATQRTLIGTTGTPGDLYLVVTEGRYTDGSSRGLQYYEAGDLLESLGCSYGIALDGGGSSTMVWNGQKLNRNIRQEVTGFVYITGPG